jgi:hypothetical protein
MTMMSEPQPQDYGETPAVVVRVYRDGRLLRQELCESEDEASLVVEEWSEHEGVTCEVDDLSVQHRTEDILAPEPPEPDSEEEHRRAVEPERSAGREAWERYRSERAGG